jgi:hypothetical protein
MHKIVYKLPHDNYYAFVSRSGSSSIGLMVMNYNKHPMLPIYNNMYDFHSPLVSPHRLIDYIICHKMPKGTFVVVRNPIDRIKSLICRTGINIDRALAGLYWVYNIGTQPKNITRDELDRLSVDVLYHFRPISTIIENDSILIPFEKIHDLPKILNLDGVSLPCVNKNVLPVPDFTSEQLNNIYDVFYHDIDIWKSLQ